jgi:hypothetical protein
MLETMLGDQMKLTASLTEGIVVSERSSSRDEKLQVPLMIEGGARGVGRG